MLVILTLLSSAAMQSAYANINIPPYGSYVLVQNTNGKQSSSSTRTNSNGRLCPCEIAVLSNGAYHCSTSLGYGAGTVEEYKKANFNIGSTATYSITYTFKAYGYQYQTGSGWAYMKATVLVYDSSGSLVGSHVAYTNNLTSIVLAK